MADQTTDGEHVPTPSGRTRRLPKPVTAARLEKVALAHIDRYATSTANLRTVLLRRVERSVRLHGTDRTEATGWADAVIAKLIARRLLDDAAYARTRAASLHRAGASRRKITATLTQKGVGRDDIGAALAALAEEFADSELAAAVRYARRRRLGPYRGVSDRAERRERDLAALARAGFGYDTAQRVVEASSSEALEDAALTPARD